MNKRFHIKTYSLHIKNNQRMWMRFKLFLFLLIVVVTNSTNYSNSSVVMRHGDDRVDPVVIPIIPVAGG